MNDLLELAMKAHGGLELRWRLNGHAERLCAARNDTQGDLACSLAKRLPHL